MYLRDKIIIGVIALVVIVGGFFGIKSIINSGGEEFTLTNDKATVVVKLPKEKNLNKGEKNVTGFINLTEKELKQKEKEEKALNKAIAEGDKKLPTVTSDVVYSDNYKSVRDKNLRAIAIIDEDGKNIQYELCNTEYDKSVLETINKDVKTKKAKKAKYMYTFLTDGNSSSCYIIVNKIKDHSVFITVSSVKELNDKEVKKLVKNLDF